MNDLDNLMQLADIYDKAKQFYDNYPVEKLKDLTKNLRKVEIPRATSNTIEYLTWYNERFVEPIASSITILEILVKFGEEIQNEQKEKQ